MKVHYVCNHLENETMCGKKVSRQTNVVVPSPIVTARQTQVGRLESICKECEGSLKYYYWQGWAKSK